MTAELIQIPALTDNYIYLFRDEASGEVAVVDPALAEPVEAALAERGWQLNHILNTHHHFDHTGGNLALKEKYGCPIIGPRADEERIPGIDLALAEGETYAVGTLEGLVFDTPGHTKGHIAFWFEAARFLFCGDTLFSMGCGRLFEGTAEQMWSSLSKFAGLPDDAKICCAHEYTLANARFSLTIDPDNLALIDRVAEVERLRQAGVPTVPSLMGVERATNPFLRAADGTIRTRLGLEAAENWQVFAEIRRRKDVA